MKIKATTAIVVTIVPLVATFAPGLVRHRSKIWTLNAAADDLPDIVKAYKKVKPQVSVPELSLPSTPPEPPVVELPVPTPVEPVTTETSTFQVPEMPQLKMDMPEMPQIKMDMPEMPQMKMEMPSAPEISEEFKSSVSDSMDAVKRSIPSLKSTADSVNAQFKGLNDFFKAAQEQAATRAAENSAAKVPTLGEMLSNGLTARRATFTELSSSGLPEGKAPNLVEYFTSGMQSPSGGLSMDTLAESKAKLGLLVENTYALINGSPPPGLGEMSLPGTMTPETAAGIAAGTFGLLLLAGNNNKNSQTSVPDMPEIILSEAAVAVMSEDVSCLEVEILLSE